MCANRFQAHGMADHLYDLDLSEATHKQVAQVNIYSRRLRVKLSD